MTHRCLVANAARRAIDDAVVGQQHRLALRVQRVADRLAQPVRLLGLTICQARAGAGVGRRGRRRTRGVSRVTVRVKALP